MAAHLVTMAMGGRAMDTGDRPQVCRRLFDEPDVTQASALAFRWKQRELEAFQAFSQRWNLREPLSEGHCSDGESNHQGHGHSFRWARVKSASDSNLPEFYSRGYSQTARRKALTPRAGKSLSFPGEEDHEGAGRGRTSSPVQYMEESSVEVFLGMKVPSSHTADHTSPLGPSPSSPPPGASVSVIPPPPVTIPSPHPVDCSTSRGREGECDIQHPPPSQSCNSAQTLLTDSWRVRKRSRSPTGQLEGSEGEGSKRERTDDDGL